jgi:hypothetical protein
MQQQPFFSHWPRLAEMRIWCIKIRVVLVLHFNPSVEACAGGLIL